MSQQGLFFESIEDAAKEIARHYEGGAKELAHRLWPNKSPTSAHTRWLDCCNENRTEHNFSGEDWLALIKIGREIGCHAVINFICDDAEYSRPTPVEPEDELTALLRERRAEQRRAAEIDERIMKIAERMERRSGAHPK